MLKTETIKEIERIFSALALLASETPEDAGEVVYVLHPEGCEVRVNGEVMLTNRNPA